MDVTGVGYEGGRFIAANVKAQRGGWITTLSCKEGGEVDKWHRIECIDGLWEKGR